MWEGWLLCLEFADTESSCFEIPFRSPLFPRLPFLHSDDDDDGLGEAQLAVLVDVISCGYIE